jgi:hypothetical protein
LRKRQNNGEKSQIEAKRENSHGKDVYAKMEKESFLHPFHEIGAHS